MIGVTLLLALLVATLSLTRFTSSLSLKRSTSTLSVTRFASTLSLKRPTSDVSAKTSTLSAKRKLVLADYYHYAPCVPGQPSNVTLDLNHHARKHYPECASPEICCTNWTSFYQPLSSLPHGGNTNFKSESRREPSSCLRLLLIVIFNSEFFENIPVIEKLYGEFFTKIVYYSDVEHSNLGVHGVTFNHGVFQQIAVADAMHRYPDYDGYLWRRRLSQSCTPIQQNELL